MASKMELDRLSLTDFAGSDMSDDGEVLAVASAKAPKATLARLTVSLVATLLVGATAAAICSSPASGGKSNLRADAASVLIAVEDSPHEEAGLPSRSEELPRLYPGATKPFPQHWGEPPRMTTKDLREWPAGYGHGSGTIAEWIKDHIEKDRQKGAAEHGRESVREESPHLYPGATKPFPPRWGEPPMMTTKDYREWPAGYGHGSGTIAKWIEEHLQEEGELPSRGSEPLPPYSGPWPQRLAMRWIHEGLEEGERNNTLTLKEVNATLSEDGGAVIYKPKRDALNAKINPTYRFDKVEFEEKVGEIGPSLQGTVVLCAPFTWEIGPVAMARRLGSNASSGDHHGAAPAFLFPEAECKIQSVVRPAGLKKQAQKSPS